MILISLGFYWGGFGGLLLFFLLYYKSTIETIFTIEVFLKYFNVSHQRITPGLLYYDQNQDDVILRTGSGGLSVHIITKTMLYFEQGPGDLAYISLPRRCYTLYFEQGPGT